MGNILDRIFVISETVSNEAIAIGATLACKSTIVKTEAADAIESQSTRACTFSVPNASDVGIALGAILARIFVISETEANESIDVGATFS